MTDGPVPSHPAGPDSTAATAPLRGWLLWLLPSYADAAFILSFVAVVVVGAGRMLNGDGDLASHLVFGDLMLSTGSIPGAYPFSWGPEGLTFLAHSWLGQISLAVVHNTFGLAGVLVLAATLVALSMSLLVRFLLTRGVRPVVVLVGFLLVLGLSSVHWLGRSHLYTWLGAVLLMSMLEARRRVPLWAYAALFAVWANLHGGFLFGILYLGAHTAGKLADSAQAHPQGWRESGFWTPLLPLMTAVAATLLNPRGPFRYIEIVSHLGDSSHIDLINEWVSPDFHHAGGRVFLLLLMITMLALCTRPSLPKAWIAVVLLLAAQGLLATRNTPLFGLVAFPLVLTQLARATPLLREKAGASLDSISRLRKRGPGLLPVALVIAGLFAASREGRIGGVELIPNSFSSLAFPVEAVNEGRSAGIGGRLFNTLGWGGYVIYAWPEQKPYLDGILYSGDLLNAQRRIEDVDPGWDVVLDRLGIETVLVPSLGRLAYAMDRHPDWRRWHCDPVGAVFLRRDSHVGQDGNEVETDDCPIVGG